MTLSPEERFRLHKCKLCTNLTSGELCYSCMMDLFYVYRGSRDGYKPLTGRGEGL